MVKTPGPGIKTMVGNPKFDSGLFFERRNAVQQTAFPLSGQHGQDLTSTYLLPI